MSTNRKLRCAVAALIVMALLLPIAACVVMALAALLRSMGDATGGAVLGWIALALGAVWTVNLIALVIVGAVRTLADDGKEDDPEIHE